MNFPTVDEKFKIVLERNTYFFHEPQFEEKHESTITTATSLLLLLKNNIEQVTSNEERKKIIVSFIREQPEGLKALLTLLGLSRESLLRLVTFIRIVPDPDLRRLVNYSHWGLPEETFRSEISEKRIIRLIKENEEVAKGVVNLFFEGVTLPILRDALPLFEFKKLSFTKLNFSTEALVDTIIRYKYKGSFAAAEANNAAGLIRKLLEQFSIPFQQNPKVLNLRRNMDFAIPNKIAPKIIIESSYVVTTASEMGDKAKTEIEVAVDIKKYFPQTSFLGFIDGIGWYVRQGDLRRIVSAFDDVYTFQEAELRRFIDFIKITL